MKFVGAATDRSWVKALDEHEFLTEDVIQGEFSRFYDESHQRLIDHSVYAYQFNRRFYSDEVGIYA